jgi:hypothetical protein
MNELKAKRGIPKKCHVIRIGLATGGMENRNKRKLTMSAFVGVTTQSGDQHSGDKRKLTMSAFVGVTTQSGDQHSGVV